MKDEPQFGCIFLSWVVIIFAAAALAGIVFQKVFPFLFPD